MRAQPPLGSPPLRRRRDGTYTRIRNSIYVKGMDVNIHGYGLVELHLAYHDGHTRRIHIQAAHAPNMI
jgi:hypothetical protein